MIVKDLLQYVDIERLANIRESHIEDWERPMHAPRESFVKHMSGFISTLSSLSPDPTPYENEEDCGGYVMYLLPYIDADIDDGHVTRKYEAAYVKRSDFDRAIANARSVGDLLQIDPNAASFAEMEAFLDDTAIFIPQCYSYVFSEWEKTLAAEVIPGCFGIFDEISERDARDEFIYDLLWEMSFNGYTKEYQNERREELQKSIEESERIRKLSEDEQKLYYHDAEEVFRDIYDKNGWEYHKKTEDEKEQDRIMHYREFCMSRNVMLDIIWKLAAKQVG